MKILVQFPTLGRPEKFLTCFSKYLSTLSGKHVVKFNVNCDISDETMNNEDVIQRIQDTFEKYDPGTDEYISLCQINFNDSSNKIEAININIEGNDFDIVVCASDDMVPQVQNWDDEIATAMQMWFPDLDGCVHFDDGNTHGKLITFSILGRKLYDHFGYIYHPDYKSLYCDDEFTQEVRRLGKEKYIDKVIVSHEHYSIQGTINSGDVDFAAKKTLYYSGRDQIVFEHRKRLGFPKQRITND
jgi:uncharacterized protein YlbG (UPF0298 family)